MKERLPYQTLIQLSIINSTGLAMLFLFCLNGWLEYAIAADPTYIIFLIMALTFISLFLSITRSWQIDNEIIDINLLKQRLSESAFTPENVRVLFENRLSFLNYVSTSVVMLGLIGTVVGFIVGLFGIDPSSMRDIDSMVASVGQILAGMSIAFYTTLAGAIAYLWIESNILVLNKGLTKLYLRSFG